MPAEATLAVSGETPPTIAGRLRSAWSDLPLAARIAGGVLLFYVAVAVTGPQWAPYDPTEILVGDPFAPPSGGHLFGTDNLGRDVLSRVVHGSAAVLALALSATGLAVAVGSLIGLMLGYLRGWIDEVGMRIVDVIISIPPLVLALLIIGALGNSAGLVVLTVAFLFAPRVARTVRAATLAIVTEDYVTAAVTRGESAFGIAVRELLPNVSGTMFVEFSIRSGYAIMFIGTLSFLGFGAPPPSPEWGLMINEGRSSIAASVWPVLTPALAMAGLVIALNLFTEGVSRVLGQSMPRGRKE